MLTLLNEIRKNLSSDTLKELLTVKHEDEMLDFKEIINLQYGGWVELAKDIMAFGNTKGGHIVIGVKEDKEKKIFNCVGVPDDYEINDITLKTKLRKYLSHVPEFGISNHIINGLKYTLIYISKSEQHISAMIVGQYTTEKGKNKEIFNPGEIYHRDTSECIKVIDYNAFFSKYFPVSVEKKIKRILHNLPKSPVYGSESQFIGRDTEKDLLRKYVQKEPGTLSILIDGRGGVGKTSLSQYYAFEVLDLAQKDKLNINVEFIVWNSSKDEELSSSGRIRKEPQLKSLEDLFFSIAKVLNAEGELNNFSEFEEKQDFIISLMDKYKGGILFLDNLETFYDSRLIDFLAQIDYRVKTIITSRHKNLDSSRLPVNRTLEVKPMTGLTGGRELVTVWGENLGQSHIANMTDNAKDEFVETAFGLPLIVINTINDIANGLLFEDAVKGLKSLHIDSDLLEFQFERSFKHLPINQKKVFFTLAFFDEPQNRQTIGAISGIHGVELDKSLTNLVNRRLILQEAITDIDGLTYYTMEPLAKVYAKGHLSVEPQFESELQTAFNDHIIITEKSKDILLKPAFGKGFKFGSVQANNAAAYASHATRIWKINKNYKEVEDKFKKAQILAPELGYIYSQWGWVCEQAAQEFEDKGKKKSMLENVRTNYIKACQLDEDNIRVWYQRGMFELRQNIPDDAQACFERGLECKGQADDPRCWHGIGRCFSERALKAFRENGRFSSIPYHKNALTMYEKSFIVNPRSKTDTTHNVINWYYLARTKYYISNSPHNLMITQQAIKSGLKLDPTNLQLLKLDEQVKKALNR